MFDKFEFYELLKHNISAFNCYIFLSAEDAVKFVFPTHKSQCEEIHFGSLHAVSAEVLYKNGPFLPSIFNISTFNYYIFFIC